MVQSTSALASSPSPASPRPGSTKSNRSVKSSASRSRSHLHSAENTPLLARVNSYGTTPPPHRDSISTVASLPSEESDDEEGSRDKSSIRASLVALVLLCIASFSIIAIGFLTPAAVEEYATNAASFEPDKLAVKGFTSNAVQLEVSGEVFFDANRVHKFYIRRLGRLATWMVGEVHTGVADVEVLAPAYGQAVLGTAIIPPLAVDVRDGHRTYVSFITDVVPGPPGILKQLVDDLLSGRKKFLDLEGRADLPLRAGLVPLGRKRISKLLKFHQSHLIKLPKYEITKLVLKDSKRIGGKQAVAVDASIKLQNPFSVGTVVPSIPFTLLVSNCDKVEPHLRLAEATTGQIIVEPKKEVEISITGLVHELSDSLTAACPNSKPSPLDSLLGDYLHEQSVIVYVQGSNKPSESLPSWVTDLVSNIVVPVPFPGRNLDHLVKSFSISGVHFKLPDQTAPPDSPEAQPKVSGDVKAVIDVPKGLNFPLDVKRVRATADVFHEGEKLGVLDLRHWQSARSSQIDNGDDQPGTLIVDSHVQDAPLEITNHDVFTKIIQALIFGRRRVLLEIKADVDVEVESALGKFVVNKLPAAGVIVIDPISHNGLDFLSPSFSNLMVLETDAESVTFEASIGFINPTNYTAHVPYFDVEVLSNGTIFGHVSVRDANALKGRNDGIIAKAVFNPIGNIGKAVGKELLSRYISGFNTMISVRPHSRSIPALPGLGKALSRFELDVLVPRPKIPLIDGDEEDEDEQTHFIRGATMHLVSSTAVFKLVNPFATTPLYLSNLNATAYHRVPTAPPDGDSGGDDDTPDDPTNDPDEYPVGTITHAHPFQVAPHRDEPDKGNGDDDDDDGGGNRASITPRLPVRWSLGSVGFDAVRQAVGGRLRLSARATVTVRIGNWAQDVWFVGRGIGAAVRL